MILEIIKFQQTQVINIVLIATVILEEIKFQQSQRLHYRLM
jgi:hypothetical protein